MNKKLLILTVAAGMAMCSQNLLADVVVLPAATQEVLQTYPGTRVHTEQGRVRIIYGAPMNVGLTPEAAAATWVELHGAALGAPDPDLRLDWSATLRDERFTVFALQQYIDDMPVEAGIARILVRNDPVPRVVYAAGTLAPATPQDLAAPLLEGEIAVELVRAQRIYRALPKWSEPELAVFHGIGEWREPVLTWKFRGTDPELNRFQDWTFFVSAQTGQVVHVRNEVHYDNNITGTVAGWGSPHPLPDVPANPPQLLPIGDIRMSIWNGTSALANPDGTFELPHFGLDPVDLRVRLGPAFTAGRWVSVVDQSGDVEQLSLNVTPPGPVSVVFSSPTAALNVAQVNAFVHTNRVNEFFRTRAGTWTGLNHVIRANVNLDQTCNAFYGGGSINFFLAGGGCPNTAYSSVIAHEYGHHIVNQLGLTQGGFGEGFADLCGMLLDDDGVVGRYWNPPNPAPLRNPVAAAVQYPCEEGGIHHCGQLLGAIWWRIRQSMGTYYGSAEGLERTQQLFVDWALITTGGEGVANMNSAHPGTVIEVLTVNDDDGILANGTPDLPRICPAFDAHNLTCPDVAAVKWVFPEGFPDVLTPDEATDIDVNVLPMGSNPTDFTGRLFYRVNGGTWVQTDMARLAAHEYRGTIPAQMCGSVVDYYFTVNVGGIGSVFYPPTVSEGGVGRSLFVPVAESVSVVFSDDFEDDRGWLDNDPSDDAITGRWTREIPEPTAAQPGDTPVPGSVRCWVTDYRAGAQVSDYDVDGGKTTLISPLINLQGRNNPIISFWVWYSNDVGPLNANTNMFEVDVTSDDGASWINAVTLGPDGPETSGGWRHYRFRLNDFVPTTSSFRIRFVAADYTGAIVEAAVDGFSILSLNCGPSPSFGCYANCDGSTTEPLLTVDDFVCFVDRFAANDPWANCDGSTGEPMLTVDDFVCFINTFAMGCP